MSLLKPYREQIDEIDKKIIDLLNERVKVVLEIGKIKDKNQLPYYHPEREKTIIDSLQKYNSGGFPNRIIETIFREIISASRSLEKNITVAYLGPKASYTHLACLKQFGSSVNGFPVASITDVFKEVENDKADYGIVPVENSYGGVVTHTLDMFVDSPLKICSEYFLQVSHCLMSKLDDISKIKKIYSHTQSFAQCRLWLENNLPNAEKIEASSNSKAASLVEWDKFSAAIASEIAAEVYDLNILGKNIQDSSENITRFLIISKNTCDPTGNDKTSVICTISDEVGALLKILAPFQKRNINLTKVESRPSRKRAWDYLFFIDLKAHLSNEPLKEAIEEVKKVCINVKILGSYPKGNYPE
ncbi:MAG: prephenate dehydratase [Spirochaetota bacterium]|nr:prephenate dehydratase [Spirochaetota bacterium]